MDKTYSAWWKCSKENVHNSVFSHLKHLENTQGYKDEVDKRHIRIYGNLEIMGLDPATYSKTLAPNNPTNLKLNVAQSCVDTLCSKIARVKTRPMFLTEKANYRMQKNAKKLNMFTEGIYYDSDVYSKSRRTFLDAAVMNWGVFKYYRQGDKIYVDRTFPNEIKISDREAWGGKVRQLHQVKYIHRDVLIDLFGKNKETRAKIEDVEAAGAGYMRTDISDVDLIAVAESWYLADKDNKNGRWAISIKNCTLQFDEYKRQTFPFSMFKMFERMIGMEGQGLVERLTPIQVEINKLLKTVQISLHLHGIPKILLDASTKVPEQHFDNDFGMMMRYIGVKPEIWAGRILHPEIFEQIDRLYSRAFEISGISQLSAGGVKPSGIEAMVALRELQDIETERFSTIALNWEQFLGVDVAKQLVDIAKEVSQDEPNYKMLSVGKNHVEEIKWKDINIDELKYYLKAFPASQLPKTPAARQQWLQERFQAGLIDRDTYIDLSDFPDTQEYTDLDKASRDVIREYVDLIVIDGEYREPEKYMNLEFGLKYSTQVYNKCIIDKVPERNMNLLRQWIDSILILLNPEPMQPQPTSGMPPQVGAGGQPALPPASSELPPQEPELNMPIEGEMPLEGAIQ